MLRTLTEHVAEQLEDVYERAVSEGRMTVMDAYDTAYRELRGAAVAERLGRYADVRNAPSSFTPEKYRTSYDDAVDLQISAIFDRTMAEEPRIASMAAFDLNAFLIALPTGPTAVTDWPKNRAKRIIDDPMTQSPSGARVSGWEPVQRVAACDVPVRRLRAMDFNCAGQSVARGRRSCICVTVRMTFCL